MKLLTAAAGATGSPLAWRAAADELDFKNGRIIHKGQPESGETFTAFLARNGNKPLGAIASAEPDQDAEAIFDAFMGRGVRRGGGR